MTRSKALQFLLVAAMIQIFLATALLWTDRAAGWALFGLGAICVAAFLAALAIDVVASLRQQTTQAPSTEFDL